MAVSLAFGVVFATFIPLVPAPAEYLMLDDVRSLIREAFLRRKGKKEEPSESY